MSGVERKVEDVVMDYNCNYLQFDEYFKKIKTENFKYLPFVGINFSKSVIKTLIVGESLYKWGKTPAEKEKCEKEISSEFFLRKTVIEQGLNIKKGKKYHRFYRNIERLIKGNDIENFEKRMNFWSEFSFHEFILESMGSLNQRPTIHQYKDGAKALIEVSEILKIEKCIFLGSEFEKFDIIQKEFEKHNFEVIKFERKKIGRNWGRKRIFKKDKLEITIYFVKHPSAFFSWKLWHNFIKGNKNV